MSYYSNVSLDFRIRLERLTEFTSQLEQLVKAMQKEQNEDNIDNWIAYNLAGLSVNNNGELDYEDYHSKHYDTDKFAWWLKDYSTKGRMKYMGEDDDQWGYEFNGKGKVYYLEFVERRGEEFLLTREWE